jgi:acyl-CoA thioester hydrolase
MLAHDFSAPPSAYRHSFQVDAQDIDALGHANNVVWVRWINEAAIAHATNVGLGQEACRALGVLWVVRRHDLEYLLPAFAGETIEAFTWPETLRGASSLRRTLFERAGQVLARAETTWVLIDLQTGRPRRAPSEMLTGYGFGP